MSRPRLKQPLRGLGPAALLVVVPKCALCLLAYAGLGLGGPELCGAPGGTAGPWALGLSALGVVAGAGAVGYFVHRRRPTVPVAGAAHCSAVR